MENTGIKGLLVTLHQRVILSWKSTLIGIGVFALSIVAEYAISALTASPSPWVHQLGAILGGIYVMVKDKLPKPPPVDVAGAAVVLLVAGLSLAAPSRVRADEGIDTDQGGGFLTYQINEDWSLHLNASLAAFEYDLTNKRFIGQANFGGLYMLDYRGLVAAGLGGSFQTDGTAGNFVGNFAVASPKITLAPAQVLRVAVLLQAQSRASKWSWAIAVGPTYQF